MELNVTPKMYPVTEAILKKYKNRSVKPCCGNCRYIGYVDRPNDYRIECGQGFGIQPKGCTYICDEYRED